MPQILLVEVESEGMTTCLQLIKIAICAFKGIVVSSQYQDVNI